VVASEVRKLAERSQSARRDQPAVEFERADRRAGRDHAGKLVPDIQKTAELVQEITASSKNSQAARTDHSASSS